MHNSLWSLALTGLVSFGTASALGAQEVEAGQFSALDERPGSSVSAVPAAASLLPPDDRLPEPSPFDPLPSATRATFTVGSDSNCDFSSLNEALASPLVTSGDVLNLRSDLNQVGTLSISNRSGSLTLRGGFSSCSATTPNASTTFSGNGGRVVNLSTSAGFQGPRMVINLERITITGGTAGPGLNFGGGGLLVNGRPGGLEVNLRRVTVQSNTTDFNGGGISVRVNDSSLGTSPPAMLDVDAESVIAQNTAQGDGGGLSCFSETQTPPSTLVRLNQVFVAANEARNGGGIAVNGCYNVLVYPGISLRGINSNSAVGGGLEGNGGGIYVRGDNANVRLVGGSIAPWGDPANGGFVGGNSARRGGGLYVRDDVQVTAEDINFLNNTAALEGGAVYAEGDGAVAKVERFTSVQACRPGSGILPIERCSVVSGNNGGNAGGAFSARNGGQILVEQTRVINNQANVAAIAASSGNLGDSLIRLESVVAWGNASVWPVATTHGIIELRWSTFTDNQPSDSFLYVNAASGNTARIRVYGSILRESGQTDQLLGTGTGSIFYDCVIGWQNVNELVGGRIFYRVADPEFVNPETRDYRPGPTSYAIDYCDDRMSPPSRDFNGLSRGLEHIGDPLDTGNPGVGFYDLGAFEPRWRVDRLFRDRFQQN